MSDKELVFRIYEELSKYNSEKPKNQIKNR